jgi:mono/diheme cytochrome c family protein
MDYPIWDVALGGGMLMAVVAIAHVIVAHFAIGGGLLIVVTETLAVRRADFELRELARRSSLLLILVSTVFGAISGVGIWVVAGLISPAAISALIHIYVWGWAIEWVFFILEIVAALVYYGTWGKISKQAHVMVGWLYVVGAYMSLVVINGIVTFMLTPGAWLASGAFWDGFFNPTYWPSLVLRTGIALMMATVFMVFVALRASAERRDALLRYLGWWLLAGSLLAYLGYRWWEAVLPGTVRNLFRGAEPALAQLAATRSFALWSLTAALLLGLVVLVLAPRLARVATAAVLALTAFAFFGGFERLREGVRKPFLIHSHLFSNGLLASAIPELNESGVAAHSGWVARGGEGGVELGRALFRAQCASCHTLDGYQGIRRALPSRADLGALAAAEDPALAARLFREECAACHRDLSAEEMRGMLPSAEEMGQDPEMTADLNRGMIAATLLELRDMGEAFTAAPRGAMVDTAPLFAPYMPPFVGTDDELEALTAYLASLDRGAEPMPARKGSL